LPIALLFFVTDSLGQEENEEELPDIPIADVEELGAVVDLDVDDVPLTSNPLSSLVSNWPPDLVVAPVPGRSPQMGWNLALAAGYFLTPKDENSDVPPSVLGAYGFFAENGSNVYGAGVKLNLFDDKLRVTAGGGYADIRYRFYGIGRDQGDMGLGLDILQEGPAYFATARWRLFGRFYAGLGYLGGHIDTRLRVVPEDPGQFFDPTLSLDVGAVSIPLEIDSRDHEYFPRSGWLWKAEARFYRDAFGSDFDTETLKISANHYWPMRETDVLATRLVVRATGENAPFFILSSFGGSTDLRGYPGGRYRDRMMYALQSEYRWQVNDRWILTGFAGFGEVASSASDFGEDLLPAAGVGARFVISEKHRVALSADIAMGNDGTEFYFGVGEAF
jgi:outer membrane protein assembly factor BamA